MDAGGSAANSLRGRCGASTGMGSFDCKGISRSEIPSSLRMTGFVIDGGRSVRPTRVAHPFAKARNGGAAAQDVMQDLVA